MTIRTRLQISSIVYMAITLGIGLALFMEVHNVGQDLEKARINYAIVTGLVDLAILADDYAIHPERRSLRQWQAKHSEVTKFLGRSAGLEIDEPETMNRLIQDSEEINSTFSRLVSDQAKIQSDEGQSKTSVELRDKLIGMLGLQLQSMISDARLLHSASQARISASLARSIWIAMLFLAVTASIILGNHLLTRRALIGPLTKLSKGTQIIGSGMLDHVVDIKTRDEMGELAQAFNTMTGDLKKSYEGLESEIEARKQVEKSLRQTTRALKALSDSNQALLRAGTESFLLDEICRIIVEVGGYRGTWVGFAQHDETRTVRPMAQFGLRKGFVETFNVTWGDDETGRGPTGMAIRTGQVTLARNVTTDPLVTPWREQILELGHASVISLPLIVENQTIGAITIFSDDHDAFDKEEMGLLEELAGDLAYGITSIRRKEGWKAAERALRESEALFRSVLESTTDCILVWDKNYNYLYANQAAIDHVGTTRDNVIGKNMRDGLGHVPDFMHLWIGRVDQVLSTGQPMRVNDSLTLGDKAVFSESVLSPIMTADGNMFAVGVVYRDVTERMEQGEKLKQSEHTLRSLVDGNPESLFMADTEGIILVANEEVARRLGTTVSELIGSSMYDFVPPDVAEGRKEHIQEVIRTGNPVRFEDTRLGRRIDNHIQPIVDDQGKVTSLVILGIDITELRKAEEVKIRLAAAIEQSAESVIITDADGVIQYANPTTERITGFGRSEIIGNSPRIFKSGEHDRAYYEQLWNTIKAGNVWSGRFINKKKDGTLYQEDATISPVRDASGKTINFVAVKRDITEHLELSKQLFQAQKMEAIGTLAGGVAHDFNNLLTVVMGYSELLLTENGEQDPAYADLQKTNQTAQKGADLVRRLLAFSRKVEVNARPLNLNHQIEQLEKMLTRTIPKMINIKLKLADPLSSVNADPTQIDQVLMNLAVNAKDAMPEGGNFTIETANVSLDEEYARTHLGIEPGEYVLLTVSDTGHGMDRETLDRIFEPFYTTKEAGKGTGLGLAMVYGIVTQHGGQVHCYSEPGHGTTFKMYLPALADESDRLETTAREAMPRGGTETLLLVDDEEFVRDLGKRILERSGYTVLAASNGREALDLYTREKEKISLVILDLIMPEMGGRQCLEELLEIDPKARVIIASGFAANGQTREAIETGARGFVVKPYNMKEMLRVVRKVLDAER